ncbi:unnamed protein product [Wuchereria bancrofti]|uniref:Uncharacterized protein n=1 Tax=Wuchereria bancrofti TaxID=6293 RepID=A0A3P7DJG7_WUCBA|nr:unnamed protein product [Wuchereria bancrofti]
MHIEQRWDGWSGDDDDVDTGTFGRSSLHGCVTNRHGCFLALFNWERSGGVVDAMCKISLALQIQFVSKEGCSVGRSYDRVLLGGAEGSTSEVRQRRSNSSRNLYETVCGYGTMTVVSCRPGGLPNRTPPMRAHNIYEPPPGRSSSSCPFHIPHLYLLSFPLHHF